MNKPFIIFENVEKIYHMGEVEIKAVNGADFSIEKGEFTVIVGPAEQERLLFSTCSGEWTAARAAGSSWMTER